MPASPRTGCSTATAATGDGLNGGGVKGSAVIRPIVRCGAVLCGLLGLLTVSRATAQIVLPGGAALRLQEQVRPPPPARPARPTMRLEEQIQPPPPGAEAIRFTLTSIAI